MKYRKKQTMQKTQTGRIKSSKNVKNMVEMLKYQLRIYFILGKIYNTNIRNTPLNICRNGGKI